MKKGATGGAAATIEGARGDIVNERTHAALGPGPLSPVPSRRPPVCERAVDVTVSLLVAPPRPRSAAPARRDI